MILVDTTVWVDYFNGKVNDKTVLLEKCLEEDVIVVGDLILCELLQGFVSEADAAIAMRELSKFLYADIGWQNHSGRKRKELPISPQKRNYRKKDNRYAYRHILYL
jgi:predicted nucleic acid-binding protein